MAKYVKPHRTFDEQLEILKSRGLFVSDGNSAKHFLRSTGYYTLGGYLYTMRELETIDGIPRRMDRFLTHASFDHVVALYNFDRQLRHLCLEALEHIEKTFKVATAYVVGHEDKFAHHTGSTLAEEIKDSESNKKSRHDLWLARHRSKVSGRASDAIAGFINKYDDNLPLWIAVDAMDFGDISNFFSMLHQKWQTRIAKTFGLLSGPQLDSWIRTMCDIRNTSAHHDRLWNRRIINQPARPKGQESEYFVDVLTADPGVWTRPYVALIIIAYLTHQVGLGDEWSFRMGQLLTTLPVGPGVRYEELGAPENWKTNPLWGL